MSRSFPIRRALGVAALLGPALLAVGNVGDMQAASAPKAAAAAGSAGAVNLRFTDITAAAGIHFTHNSGRAGKKYLPETLGAGCAFFDADGDGWPDILLINGRDWKPGGKRSRPALYLNNHDGTFRDATAGSGLDVEMYGMGVAVADYDNDGREDVFITALDGDRLFHNEGGGKFRDVTAASGIKNASFGTSAAWLDYDRDGKVDLFIANYVQWSPEKDLWCSLDGVTKSYCTPESYKGTSSKLYRNLGNGKFEDVSHKAGIDDPTSKSLGVTVLDYNGDGWPDLFVANDTQPNKLYRNKGDGTFVEEGLEAGVAFGEDGAARGAMGVDAGDYDRSGRPHLLVGNFSNEMLGLYHNEGNGIFVDRAPASAVGRASLLTLTFGVFFFDYDLDGQLDIFAANGHIEEEIGRVQPKIQYKEPPLLFRNLGNGRFEPATAAVGPDLNRPIVARGAAYADIDHDGDLDLLITTNNGPAYLFRNDGGNRNHWLRVKTVGTRSNRDGIGAVVRLQSAAGPQWSMVRSGSSYCSQSELVQTFGLGRDPEATALTIDWPSGARQQFTHLAADQTLVIQEDKGIIDKQGPAVSRPVRTSPAVSRPARTSPAVSRPARTSPGPAKKSPGGPSR
ncbi:MAG TPA: CRTAC1 family protein [Thermoanaerobaculia bacterium]|nr:CRTAC1 family protein [Thermoanaerobaculia bacterium]